MSAGRHEQIAVKLAKAEEYLLMAARASDEGCWDASVSLSVSAGVNASDAVMLHRTGNIVAGQSHEEAVRVLRKIPEATVANQLARLLAVKHKAQYSSNRCTRSDADAAYKRAERIFELAESTGKGGS